MVDVVGPARNGRTQVALRNVPVVQVVVALEQRGVQHFDGGGIGKINGFVLVGIDQYERCQPRAALQQFFKIVTGPVAVAGVEFQFFFGVLFFSRLHAGSPVNCAGRFFAGR